MAWYAHRAATHNSGDDLTRCGYVSSIGMAASDTFQRHEPKGPYVILQQNSTAFTSVDFNPYQPVRARWSVVWLCNGTHMYRSLTPLTMPSLPRHCMVAEQQLAKGNKCIAVIMKHVMPGESWAALVKRCHMHATVHTLQLMASSTFVL